MNAERDDDSLDDSAPPSDARPSGRVRVRPAFPERRQSGLIPRAEVPAASPIPREAVERALSSAAPPVAPDDALCPPPADRVTAELLSLAAETSPEMSPARLTAAYQDALGRLFVGRRVSIRLVPEGPERDADEGGAGDAVPLSRAALARHRRAPEDVELDGVELTTAYVPRFSLDAAGVDVPLFDHNRVTGVLALEYAPGVAPPDGDLAIVIPFALQLAGLLRSARLLAEATYLREYLQKLLEHANAPIVVIGRHRDVRGANHAFSTLVGLSPEEIEGRDIFDLVGEGERTRLLPVLIDALHGKPTANFDLCLSGRPGAAAKLTINAASILTATGEVEAVIVIGSDRSEVHELQDMVIQSEKLATLGTLAASVVHELNNPLTSISVHGDYLLGRLRATDADASDIEKAQRIVDASERILAFTKDLMNYARPADSAPASVNLRTVIDESLVFCEHLFDGEHLVIERVYAEEVPKILGVVGQLHQVFINLFTNASHAMRESGGTLRVTTRPTKDGEVEVEVRDDGDGISVERIERVFDPFFTTKETGTGTGLGLSVVRNIVSNHRGQILVESTPGQGAVFTLRFPVL